MEISMNSAQLTFAITALANTISQKLTDDEIALLSSVLVQLGDTLATISTNNQFSEIRQITE